MKTVKRMILVCNLQANTLRKKNPKLKNLTASDALSSCSPLESSSLFLPSLNAYK